MDHGIAQTGCRHVLSKSDVDPCLTVYLLDVESYRLLGGLQVECFGVGMTALGSFQVTNYVEFGIGKI